MTISYLRRGALASRAISSDPEVASLDFLRGTATTAAPTTVTVCTAGVWSVRTAFRPCDDFRITIDGPSADQTKISATIEFDG